MAVVNVAVAGVGLAGSYLSSKAKASGAEAAPAGTGGPGINPTSTGTLYGQINYKPAAAINNAAQSVTPNATASQAGGNISSIIQNPTTWHWVMFAGIALLIVRLVMKGKK